MNGKYSLVLKKKDANKNKMLMGKKDKGRRKKKNYD